MGSFSSLRVRILLLAFLSGAISVTAAGVSLLRVSDVSRVLDGVNRVGVPLGRFITQLERDAENYRSEGERRFAQSQWSRSGWEPKPIPQWVMEVLASGISRSKSLLNTEGTRVPSEIEHRWGLVLTEIEKAHQIAITHSQDLARVLGHLHAKPSDQTMLRDASVLYPKWVASQANFTGKVAGAARDLDSWVRESFTMADKKMEELRLGLGIVLATACLVACVLLLLSYKAIRGTAEREREMVRQLHVAESLAAVGRLSAQVAHEVRNPLHSIGLEAELGLELASKSGNIPLKQSLLSILDSVERLEKVTESYLKLARPSRERRESLDLVGVLEATLATYANACESAQVKVEWERESGKTFICEGDPGLLEQALGNLFRNSLQSLDRPGTDSKTIRWKLETSENNKIKIRIEDSGPGLSSEVRKRLFEPFVTTRADGTGLGLAFVRKVALEHSGDVEYRPSDKLGGACFEITLPRIQTHERKEIGDAHTNLIG